ncbi:MAG: crossover junction endodeoxyribonuclease RuvC [Candidatus Algichlamydia australiensis]|nr:crossover junction endodeoxyribonuclease RuvC [Chlamydiales bacterium]
MKRRIIFGIDPGTQATGYGIIAVSGRTHEALSFGVIRSSTKVPLNERYLHIFNELERLIDLYQPEAISVETQFVYKNVQSALKLGMARSCAILAGGRKNIPIFEYAPSKAKLAVVGRGNATKPQVQKMIQMLLGLGKVSVPEDAADALALAICHAHHLKSRRH